MVELGQQALTDVRISVANGEPLVDRRRSRSGQQNLVFERFLSMLLMVVSSMVKHLNLKEVVFITIMDRWVLNLTTGRKNAGLNY